MRRRALSLLAAALLAVAPAVARAADCGPASGDVDGDGLCDALDPCGATSVETMLREPDLKLRRLGGHDGDDVVRLKAIVVLADGVSMPDPAVTGLRLQVLAGAFGADDVVLDVAAPGGVRWRVSSPAASWVYRAANPATSAIVNAVIREVPANPAYLAARNLAVSVTARRGTYQATSDLDAHRVTLAFAESGTAALCAVRSLSPWLITGAPGQQPLEAPPWEPSCKLRGHGRSLLCTSGPRVGSCRVSSPGDLMACDAERAAEAEDAQHALDGTYHAGPCSELPGFVGSPGIVCEASATPDDFVVTTSHPGAPEAGVCEWTSGFDPALVCH